MTLDQLKARCDALSTVGDEMSACVLEYLFNAPGRAEKEVVELREKNRKLADANLRLANENSRLKWDASDKESQFVGVRVNGEVMDGIIPRPAAAIPDNFRQTTVREPKAPEEPSPGMKARIDAIAKAFNVDTNDPSAAAVAATRAAHGLPAVSDPAVTAVNPDTRTGGFEKIPGENKDGNK